MAESNVERYVNNIYINGIPYKCRDENATKDIATLNAKLKQDEATLNLHEEILQQCYTAKTKATDNLNGLKGNIRWDQLTNSTNEGKPICTDIPTFKVYHISDQGSSNKFGLFISIKNGYLPKSEGDSSISVLTPLVKESTTAYTNIDSRPLTSPEKEANS